MTTFFLRPILILVVAGLFASCQKDELFVNAPVQQTGDIVPGEYIVLLRADASGLQSRLKAPVSFEQGKELMRSIASDVLVASGLEGKNVETTFFKAVKGFKVSLSESEAALLAKNPDISLVTPVRIVRIPDYKITDDNSREMAQTLPWGIKRVGGPATSVPAGVAAWIIDTGIDLDNPDLNVDEERSTSFIANSPSPNDGMGHGTHVAGTIGALNNSFGVVGVAPGVPVIGMKALNYLGSGTTDDIIEAIDHIAANAGPGDVVNMSLGGGADEALDNAVIGAANAGVRFCIAAGNGNILGIGIDAKTVSPARVNHANVYTISAMGQNDRIAIFSNFSKTIIDYAAPGRGIKSCWKGGVYKFMDGTSMACPHVAGIWLLGKVNSDGVLAADRDGKPDPIAHR